MCSKEGENILLLDIRSTRDVNDEVTKLLPVTDGKKMYDCVIRLIKDINLNT